MAKGFLLSLTFILLSTSLAFNNYDTIRTSVKDMKVVHLNPSKDIVIVYIDKDTEANSFLQIYNDQMVNQIPETAVDTTKFNEKWGMIQLSAEKIVIGEGSNLHFIDTTSGDHTHQSSADFATEAPFLSMTPGRDKFYIIRVSSNTATVYQFGIGGAQTSSNTQINNIEDKHIDCAAFSDDYLACFYKSPNNNQHYHLFDSNNLAPKENKQVSSSQSSNIIGIKAILLDSANNLVLSVTMRSNVRGRLYAVIFQKNSDALNQVSPSSNDCEIMTECRDMPQFVFLSSLTSDTFLVSCKRYEGVNYDFIYSKVQYDVSTHIMTPGAINKVLTLWADVNYFSYFYTNPIEEEGSAIYLVKSEIRYQKTIGAPKCIDYNVAPIFKNKISSLNFDSYITQDGLDVNNTGTKIIITSPMVHDLKITRGSNPININQEYDLGGFDYNSGGTVGPITYTYQVLGGNNKKSKTCDINFEVEGCYSGCKSCSSPGTSPSVMNCDECDIDNKHYPYRENTSNCALETSNPLGYVLVNGYWEKCYESCSTCSDKGTFENMNCIRCSTSPYYPLEYNSAFCYKTAPSKHFLNVDKFSNCDISCLECTNATSCTRCDIENEYYNLYGPSPLQCINEATKNSLHKNYYLNTTNKQYEPCYSTCATCDASGSSADNKCSSCLTTTNPETIANPLKPSDCVSKCEPTYFYWFDERNKYTCTAEKKCPTTHPIAEPVSNQCVKSCLSTGDCVVCKESRDIYFAYNNQCIKVCPPGTQPIDETRTCSNVDKCIKTESSSSLPAEAFAQSSDTLALEYAATYASTDKQVNLVFSEKYSVVIYKSEECARQFAAAFSKLDLENCILLLRKEYNLPSPMPLITLKMDLFRTNQPNQVSYKFYSPSGAFLDLAPCQDEKITVTVPIANTGGVNLTQAKEFEELGVDVYNASDPFFNDICFNYTSSDGTDVPLVDRKKAYYQNASICEEGCTYSGVNLTLEEASCECEIKTSFLTDLLDNPLTGELLELFNNANFEVLKCFNEVFTLTYFAKNIGGWIILSLMMVQTVFLVLYCLDGLIPMKNFLLQYIKVNPPKKQIEESVNEKDEIEEEAESPDGLVINEKTHNQPIAFNLNLKDSNGKSSKENDEMLAKTSKFKDKQPLYRHNRLNSSSKEISDDISNRVNQVQVQQANEVEAMTNAELDELVFEDAVDYDKRGFGALYWHSLKEKHSIINTFCNNNPLESASIKAMCFFFGIALYFAFNAIFYSESYISDQFASGESFNFLSLISNEISRCLYSTMIGVFVGIILGCLSTQKYRIEILIKRVKDPAKFRHEALGILRSTQIKNVIFFVINYLTMAFFWYFVSAFCYCYSNTQVSWLIGGLITWVITLLFPIALCFLIAALRITGTKCKLRQD